MAEEDEAQTPQAQIDTLMAEFKAHIEWEEGMDDSTFNGYLEFARRFVEGATGKTSTQLVLMVAALLNDFRVPEKELSTGLDALTPFLLNEVWNNDSISE